MDRVAKRTGEIVLVADGARPKAETLYEVWCWLRSHDGYGWMCLGAQGDRIKALQSAKRQEAQGEKVVVVKIALPSM